MTMRWASRRLLVTVIENSSAVAGMRSFNADCAELATVRVPGHCPLGLLFAHAGTAYVRAIKDCCLLLHLP